MGHSELLSRKSVLGKMAHLNWTSLTTAIYIGLAVFALGDGVNLPAPWSRIEHLFDGKERIYPQNDYEASIARDALYGRSYDGDILTPENAPAPNDDENKKPPLWPGYPGNCTVPYVIDTSLDSKLDIIKMAMEQYHNNTCVRFIDRANETDYIRIFKGNGCYSYRGRVGGAQALSIGTGCQYLGTVVHELGHAIGLIHEHQRKDRDDNINVYIENVNRGYVSNFKIVPEQILTIFDLFSIMIYGEYAFSKDEGKLKTMEDKNKTVTLKDPYTKPGLSNTDIEHVNKLYKC